MKSVKEFSKKAIVSIVKKELTAAANSTTCIVAYQPKAPKSLKQFSKIDK